MNKFVTHTLQQFARPWLVFAFAAVLVGCNSAYSPSGGGNPPSITSLNPTSGVAGTPVTITGAYFGATQGYSTVTFNGTSATPTSWSATTIVAPVPTGAATGNVVVTVGGKASNGMTFTVTAATTPSIVSLNPTSGPVGTAVTIAGANFGATQGASTVTFNGTTATPTSWNATTVVVPVPTGSTTGNVVVKVGGVASNGLSFTASSGTGSSMGPLKQSTVNSRYFVDPAGNAVFLSGSHTWNDFLDTDTGGSTPAALDFNAYVNFLKQNQHNVTILWRKDLPEYCGWNVSGSVWKMGPWPWLRPGPGVATDSNPKFDLTQFNQLYFDRLRARVLQLQQNGIYAIVQLFDINQLTYVRCGTDGYPFSGPNNINGVSDGYTSGTNNFTSYAMTANNAISNFQDAYAKKVVDTVNDLPNVLYEVSEEQVSEAMVWWAPHMMGLVQAYEGGGTFEGTTYTAKPFQHPVGIGAMNFGDKNDPGLYASIATWIAPEIAGTSFPSNVQVNNQGKVVINDSDHALNYVAFLNTDGSVQDQNLRGYIWENITSGAEALVFMDPYEIYWTGNLRNVACLNPVNTICTGGPDPKYNPFRQAMGFAQGYVNAKMDLLKATPQGSLSSTSFCLADNAATGAEYLVYAPNGGTFTVNLSATSRTLNVEWFNPATGAITGVASITGGSTKSFTPPASFTDAVLYIVDAAGHN